MRTQSDALYAGYARHSAPCSDCSLSGYVNGDPLKTCQTCNGGGWSGHYTKRKQAGGSGSTVERVAFGPEEE